MEFRGNDWTFFDWGFVTEGMEKKGDRLFLRSRSKFYNSSYEESFLMGKKEGYLIGSMKVLVTAIRNVDSGQLEQISDVQKLCDILEISEDFLQEIRRIVQKYPNYSKKHLAEKVIFESTHLCNVTTKFRRKRSEKTDG